MIKLMQENFIYNRSNYTTRSNITVIYKTQLHNMFTQWFKLCPPELILPYTKYKLNENKRYVLTAKTMQI